MRRFMTVSMAAAMLLAVALVAPVSAKTRLDVTMTVPTIFGVNPSEFEASIPGCTEGDTYTGDNVVFPPPFGVFIGYKLFDCGGEGETGFLVRLNARFSYVGEGSVGTWTIVDSWGALAGMTGSGKLTGEFIDGGILDSYFGSIVL